MLCSKFVTRFMSHRYAGVYLDPVTARHALGSCHDCDVQEQQQHECSNAMLPDADCAVESSMGDLPTVLFPFAWNWNATVESSSQVSSSAPLCGFVWDMPGDVSSWPNLCVFASPAASTVEIKPWEERSWSETMNALLVRHLHLRTAHCSVSSK